MKRYLWFTTMLLLLTSANTHAAVQLGVKGGITYSQIASTSTDIEVRQGSAINRVLLDGKRSRASIGGYVSFDLIAFIDLQPEVLFVQKGGEGKYLEENMTFAFSYVEVPILAKLRLPLGPTFGINACLGPSISFRQTGVIDFDDADISETPNVNNLKGRYWSGMTGLGIDMPFGPLVIGVEGRYSYALENITSGDSKPLAPLEGIIVATNETPRNETITLMASLGLKLGL